MTKYEIELSENDIKGLRALAEAVDENLTVRFLLSREKAAILDIVKQLPPPPLPDGVYLYRGNKYLSTYFVKDGKHSSSMDVETGLMPFAVGIMPSSAKDWTRIGDLPKVDNGNSVSG